jgi:hypothetical protein
VIEFRDDDEGYLARIAANPTGFLLNVRRAADPRYVVLHLSTCRSVSESARARGAYTARDYRKVCAARVEELRLAAKREGRLDGSFSKKCALCRP